MLNRVDLLIVDELGYLSFSLAGAELPFQVFADRYERGSILITSNLPFGEWGQVFQGERMTAALLNRLPLPHLRDERQSYRFRQSAKAAKEKKTGKWTTAAVENEAASRTRSSAVVSSGQRGWP